MHCSRIALVSPHSMGSMRGNITTVQRISRFLTRVEVKTICLACDALTVDEMAESFPVFEPTLIHAFHARYCGGISALLSKQFRIPFILTITGSDLHDPVLREHPETIRSLSLAAAITCFSQSDAEELVCHLPGVAGRITVIPQGVEALSDTEQRTFGIPNEAFVLLLPAALRPVKNVEFAIAAIKPLWTADHRFLLVIAGGEIDHTYVEEIRGMLATAPWVRWLGEVPYGEMGALYRRADLVLNCSRYEGMSNSIMEAMALGRPVMAADIPGNRSLLRHGDTGWLFNGESAFRTLVTMLAGNKLLRSEVGERGKKSIEVTFSPCSEAQQYRDLYATVLSSWLRAGTMAPG